MPTTFLRPFRAAVFVATAALALFACAEEPQPSTGGADSIVTTTPSETSAADAPPKRPVPETFEDIIFDEYAGLAVSVPRREQDSILQSTPMSEIEAVMTARMARQDSIAREQLAVRHGISRDSVDAILASKNVPRRR